MKTQEPINLIIPNITEQKMEAIVAISEAIRDISKALNSALIDITIAHNTFKGADTAINIETDK